MNYKDRSYLEDAYQLIFEGKQPPCPCTIGKKCNKKGCDCPKCKKALKESQDNDESLLSDPQMQDALAILNQYTQGDITNTEAAKLFKDLYEKGAGHGPTQDDKYYTGTETKLLGDRGGLRSAVPKIPGVR
jgi:hypothetical protein